MCKNSFELKIITAFISARKLKYDVKHLTLLQSIRSHTTPNHFKLPLGIDGFICICHTNFEVEKKVVLVRIVVCQYSIYYICVYYFDEKNVIYVGKFSLENEIILWKRITQPYFRYKY